MILSCKKNRIKISVEVETHEKIEDKFDKDNLYELDKLSLDQKKWRKHAFESDLKIIYDTKRPNGMSHVHDEKVNKAAG